jgi:uncharacterized alkaline shock family protein YloU
MTNHDDLDGHTIDELSDYLDSGRTPRDESIESSPGCLLALDSLERLRGTAWSMLEVEADAQPERDTAWLGRVLSNISREARAGRDIPISHPDPAVALTVTEGSVRGLIRAAGDETGGALIGACTLDGDVTVPGEPITVNVSATVAWGRSLTAVADDLRATIARALARHTELTIAAINVTITDVLPAPTTEERR